MGRTTRNRTASALPTAAALTIAWATGTLLPPHALCRPRRTVAGRPAAVVYAAGHGKHSRIDLFSASVRRSTVTRLTADDKAETGLQCTADGRFVVYVADGEVYSVRVAWPPRPRRRRRRRSGKTTPLAPRPAPVLLAKLPRDLWHKHFTRIRHFVRLSPSGRYVAVPQKDGVLVAETATGRSTLVRPAVCSPTAPAKAPSPSTPAPPATPSAAAESAAPVPAGTPKASAGTRPGPAAWPPHSAPTVPAAVRVVHPVFWMPTTEAFVYLAVKGTKGPGEVQARIHEVGTGRQGACWSPLQWNPQKPPPMYEAVEAWEAWFSLDGRTVSISLRAGTGRRSRLYHRVFGLAPQGPVHLPSGLRALRIHGWTEHPPALVVTGSMGGPVRLWTVSLRPFKTRRRRKTRMRRLRALATLSPTWGVLSYHPSRTTALVATPAVGACAKTRLVKVVQDRKPRSLIRWAQWSELLAQDPSGTWGLFRSAVRCHHPRPALYLMRVDGSLLTRALPRRFNPLRTVHPGQVALCPRIGK